MHCVVRSSVRACAGRPPEVVRQCGLPVAGSVEAHAGGRSRRRGRRQGSNADRSGGRHGGHRSGDGGESPLPTKFIHVCVVFFAALLVDSAQPCGVAWRGRLCFFDFETAPEWVEQARGVVDFVCAGLMLTSFRPVLFATAACGSVYREPSLALRPRVSRVGVGLNGCQAVVTRCVLVTY